MPRTRSQPHAEPSDDVLAEYGENDIVREDGRSVSRTLVAQFDSVLIWILAAAGVGVGGAYR